MGIISLIAAVDEKNGLGKDNQLLCHLPADLKHFKTTTMGKPIIMGRKTFDSIGKALPGRLNIVLSHQGLEIEGAIVVDSLDKALDLVKDKAESLIIGGAQIYQQTLDKASRIYLTKIHHHFPEADAFFPRLDSQSWRCIQESTYERDEKNSYDLSFYVYERITKNPVH